MRKGFCNFLTMGLLFIFTMISPGQCAYNVSNFKTDQSLYFHKMYDMSLIRDEWTLIVYYNMSTYWTGLRKIENYVSHLEKYLSNSALEAQYKSILYQLGHELSEIEHYNSILKNQIRKRQKRGLINGVGYLANSLFGVLDDSFAKKYEKDIEKISLNENHLQMLLKNQTSVLEAQYNIMRRNEGIMNKQFSIIGRHLQEQSNEVARIDSQQKTESYIMSASLSAHIIISSLRRIQDNLINVITDITHGHMDTHLLPPDQLMDQVNVISGHLQGDLTLPSDTHIIQELYKLMKVNVKVGNQYLIIELKIPLISKESLELDSVISLQQQNRVVQFASPFIAFNLQKDLLLLMTETELQTCMHSSSTRILCSTNKPLYTTPITHTLCDININEATRLCNAEASDCQERWIRLHNSNRWLFSCCQKCSVRIFCPEGMQIETLTGNGLLDLGQGCSVKSNSFSIFSHNNFFTHTKVTSDITNIPEISILNHITNFTSYSFTPEDHRDEWNSMKTHIKDLKRQSSVSSLSIHDVHQYTVLYSILAIILLAAAVCIIIRYRRSRMISLATTEVAQADSEVAQVGLQMQPVSSSGKSVVNVLHKSMPNIDKGTWITPKVIPRSQSVKLDIPDVSDCE